MVDYIREDINPRNNEKTNLKKEYKINKGFIYNKIKSKIKPKNNFISMNKELNTNRKLGEKHRTKSLLMKNYGNNLRNAKKHGFLIDRINKSKITSGYRD